MLNAAKHRRKAAEFEQQKQFDRAIALYIKAIEAAEFDGDDIDVALLNKVGDLSMRQGRVADAITYYERAVEHYTAAGLFNNAIALCNKILRSAPGRAHVYFTLGRICARKGLRGDATRNFLAYATRMQVEGRVDEGMKALAEVADLMPELTEVRALVDEYSAKRGAAPVRSSSTEATPTPREVPSQRTRDLVFLDVEPRAATNDLPLDVPQTPQPESVVPLAGLESSAGHPVSLPPSAPPMEPIDIALDLSGLEPVRRSVPTPAILAAIPDRLDADRPPFRLDPHDFILPGELPPLRVSDEVLAPGAVIHTPAAALPAVTHGQPTPVIPIAAVAAEASAHAVSRVDTLREAVAARPSDWLLRRRLAEALFEAGDREAALSELEIALRGLSDGGDLAAAADVADELVHVCPDRIAYHQRRVEVAVRRKDAIALRASYLDLADALVQRGEEGPARAVYARVLELDPRDARARAALGDAAPPLPEEPSSPSRELVTWLHEDGEPGATRLRMQEPVASGDEQADFASLLQHFKEGVARSLGEDDFASHYDLGVAFKEMGLVDDAITEFQKALRSPAHRMASYEALGQCFVEQGRHQVAVTILTRGLHEPGGDDQLRIGMWYLMGYASEGLGEVEAARGYYLRVSSLNQQFRDVAARLAALG